MRFTLDRDLLLIKRWLWLKTNLEDFCIDRLLFFVEKSDHLNSQVGRETAEFWLEEGMGKDGFRGWMHFKFTAVKKKKKKKLGRGKTYRFYIQGISFQGGWHFCDFFLQSLERERAETGFELKRDTALFQHISESIQPFLESDTYQPQSGCKVFDFLVDEAAELELAFLALDWLLILRLCAFHTEQES